jgi:DNA-binding NtrC family response regulator
MAALCQYPWPGNVRELANAVERAVVLCQAEVITPQLLPFAGKPPTPLESLAAVEENHIRRVLAAHNWNISEAARVLGIDRTSLYHKMKRYGIARP